MNSKSEIVPLVSFPKSGNTWVRFLLANLFKKDEDFKIDFKTINDISSTSYSEDHSKTISLLKEDAPLFIKEHCNYYDMPYYDFSKAIYVYRNGFDTLLSYWHFRNAQSPNKYPNIESFSKHYWNGYGDWGEHIYSWLEDKNTKSSHKVFAISYEELIENPVSTIEKCLKFLGYDIEKEKIEEAIELSNKDNMKQMSGSAEFMKSKNIDFHFVRSGSSGESKKSLPEYCKDVFMENEKNYQMMVKYNYIDNNKWTFISKKSKKSIFNLMKNNFYNYRYRIIRRW
jgi:hypothetical protein